MVTIEPKSARLTLVYECMNCRHNMLVKYEKSIKTHNLTCPKCGEKFVTEQIDKISIKIHNERTTNDSIKMQAVELIAETLDISQGEAFQKVYTTDGSFSTVEDLVQKVLFNA